LKSMFLCFPMRFVAESSLCCLDLENDDPDDQPKYFSTLDEIGGTGISELQGLCHTLAERTERREALSFLQRLQELTTLVEAHLQAYIQEDVTLAQFRERWRQNDPQ